MSAPRDTESPERIPEEISGKLRALAHDLSNSIETIMQASYLLTQSKLDEEARKWASMVEAAGRECVKINREIRDILRSHS